MLVDTKITQKSKIVAYGFIMFIMVSFSIYLAYDYYVESLELSGADSGLPAYISRLGSGAGLKVVDDEEVKDSESRIREYFDIDLFYDPKFRALKENVAEDIDLDLGKRDPFKSFVEAE